MKKTEKQFDFNDFDGYIRQGEPSQVEKIKIWKTAIGLQQVDGLTPSAYLIETAKENIEGKITFAEVQYRIDTYYKRLLDPTKSKDNRTEEADRVSANIAEILSEKTFSFSPAEYLNIHRRLFKRLYKFAGKIRTYNISKPEWVLNGETVIYAGADTLKATLEYDFEQEKKFSYNGLSPQQTVEHIATFISSLWQIHAFGEGNTRTTAVFLIKYLRALGFEEVNNDFFAQHSLYFRNALVRANFNDHQNKMYATDRFLLSFFGNLLFEEKNELKNRYLHIHNMLGDQPLENVGQQKSISQKNLQNTGGQKKWSEKVVRLLELIAENPHITRRELSARLKINPSAIQKQIENLKTAGLIKRVGPDKGGHWQLSQKEEKHD